MDIRKPLRDLPELYSTDGQRGDLPAVKLFTPDANATWVLWEYDPEDDIAFGYCDLGLGMGELGSVSIAEVAELRGALGLPVEVDLHCHTRFAGYDSIGADIPHYLEEERV